MPTSDRPITDDLVVGPDGWPPRPLHPTNAQPARGYGGHVAALGLTAAYATVAEPLSVRHLHVEYVAAAPLDQLPHFGVRAIQDGRTIARRLVEVTSDNTLVAHLSIAFHRRDDRGLDHQQAMPEALDPEDAPVAVPRPRILVRTQPVGRGRFLTWMRPQVLPIAAEPRLNEAALVYLSDLGILWPTLTAHGLDLGLRKRALGTVAHSIWIHRRVPVDDWLLFDHTTPSTSSGLGHGEGRIFTRTGLLVATCTQTGLLRPESTSAWDHTREGR